VSKGHSKVKVSGDFHNLKIELSRLNSIIFGTKIRVEPLNSILKKIQVERAELESWKKNLRVEPAFQPRKFKIVIFFTN